MNVVDNNSNMTDKLAAITAGGDSVLEEVVEEGQIVMGTGADGQQSVVMVTTTDDTGLGTGTHQIVITDNLNGGTQVIRLDDGNLVMDTTRLKTEPEDLSLREEAGVVREINLEEGAQAIQASAAACVQNVIRGLKTTKVNDKVAILPDDGLGTLVVEMPSSPKRMKTNDLPTIVTSIPGITSSPTPPNDPLTGAVLGTATANNTTAVIGSVNNTVATSNHTNNASSTTANKVSIAKQYSPFGFHCTLEAPTAQWVRKEEDRCTYLNKGQFYGITLEYRPNPTELPHDGHAVLTNVRSVVMLVFREAKNPDDEINAWDFWQSRQPSNKQRIIDVETNNLSESGISEIQDVSHNAVAVFWNPLENPALLSLAIQCLSTDFSLQKGVKGLPLHLQIDTYVKNSSDGEYDIVNRSYCQVKVFCDKGAERKCRQEERRATRKVNVGGTRVLEMYHQSQERSDFYSMVDLTRTPILYTPSGESTNTNTALSPFLGLNGSPSLNILKSSNGGGDGTAGGVQTVLSETRRRKPFPPPETRMVVYVRQENEEIYTPLHLVPPTVPGLARAIETKYNVSATAIRYLYRRNSKGIVAKLDDDLLKFYCNEDTFLMQVTAIELEGVGGQDSIMYDITLCELNDS